MSIKEIIDGKSSLNKGTFFVFMLLMNAVFVNAQSELLTINSKKISPLKGSYFLFSLGVKTFNYSSDPAHVDLVFPYTAEDNSGQLRKTFHGQCDVPDEKRHVEARTLVGLEFHPTYGPSYNCKFSISADKEPYGKFRSYDYFQLGMTYNLGVIPGGKLHDLLVFGSSLKKTNPLFVIVPGVGFIRRDKDYYMGTIDSLTGRDLYVDGEKIKGKDGESTGIDKADITYATFNHLLRLEVGVWWLLPNPVSTGVTRNFKLRRFSFRTELGYDFLLWQTQHIYVNDPESHFYLERLKNSDVKKWAVTSVERPVHHFDGISISFTFIILFGSEY